MLASQILYLHGLVKKYGQSAIAILPSSFTSSLRNKIQNYQNTIAVARKFGKLDLFYTFACNSLWPEITSIMHAF